MDKPTPITRAEHWHTRRLSMQLLLLWMVTGFCAAFFARELATLNLFGWPLSFYLAAQGSSLVYLGILAYYAWRMRRLDKAAARPAAASAATLRPICQPCRYGQHHAGATRMKAARTSASACAATI
jgi:putative solute:sodium symporter small subunit